MRRTARFLLVLLLPLLAGCEGIFAPRSCTLIGCTDGLSVRFSDMPTGAFTLEARLPNGETQTFECPQQGHCPTVVFFPGIRSEEVTLRLTTSAGTVTETHRVVYAQHRPNGRGCPPVCRQAGVTLRLAQ